MGPFLAAEFSRVQRGHIQTLTTTAFEKLMFKPAWEPC